ncbi:hypothetical protein [Bacillus thuringiensis]|uniref:hypothetical protein n=1 Tax=Bacillus thuringiensis TaxID=1428 RepID=UPI001FB82845|nr:hypothetical protein [Bacillus thuringiensis]
MIHNKLKISHHLFNFPFHTKQKKPRYEVHPNCSTQFNNWGALHICEQLLEFQTQKDMILLKLGEAKKNNKGYKEVFKTADAMDKALDRMENIKVTDKYKDIHELVLEGVTDARQGTKIILDANKEDEKEIELAILKSTPQMSGVDGEQWDKAIYELNQETKDAYAKALEKKMEEHAK